MKKFCLAMLLALLSASAWAELEVITLQHRSVEEILPVVRPLLDKDGVASGMNNQLILRTSPRNIAEIRKLLSKIDTAPRRLRITVLQDVDSATMQRLTEMSGSVGAGDGGRVTVSPLDDNAGLSVEAGEGGNQVHGRVYSTRSLADDKKQQQVTVLEGRRALIRTGQSVPVQQQQVVVSPWQTQVIDNTRYRDVTSGFYVLPRISGDRVTLEVTAQHQPFSQATGNRGCHVLHPGRMAGAGRCQSAGRRRQQVRIRTHHFEQTGAAQHPAQGGGGAVMPTGNDTRRLAQLR